MNDSNKNNPDSKDTPFRLSVSASFNWLLMEPFVMLTIDDRRLALKPEVVKQLGLSLIVQGEVAINDAMLIRVLHQGMGMDADTCAKACELLRQQTMQLAGKNADEKRDTPLPFNADDGTLH